MNQSENLPETQLEIWFSSLRAVVPRAPGAIQRGRRDFLAQASALAAPVSKPENKRHTGWIASFVNTLTTKEYSPMYTTIASFILVLALMFGGSGAAVLAAQDSLPNQSLYQVKTFTEDLALRSTFRNEHKIQMELDYAGRRVTEMTRLREMQQAIPLSTYLRLEKHLDQALLIAARSESEEMVRSLNQIRERLQNQNASLSPDLDHDPPMIRIREMIQTRISWAELGLDDPLEFQQQAQVRTQFNQQAQFEHQYGHGPGQDLDPEPGVGGFGPGPQQPEANNPECQAENCDPAAQDHFGPGQEAEEKHQYGPGPENQSEQGSQNPDPGQPAPGGNNPEPSPGSNQDQETGHNGQDSSSNPESSQGSGSNKGNGATP